MTPERWQQVKDVFQAALERDPGERAAFLDAACAGDAELRTEVERLIASHDQSDSFLESPLFEAAAKWLPEAPADLAAGRRIGPYQLIREIARGGMGAVYLALRADEQYRKRVAVKLLKRGMETDFILRRFRQERQILASLDHPNIAKLLDGGTTEDGLPYFVMEYIEGTPIDQYCDRHKLTTEERLELFRQVCSAVHYAHQNLVVHRDLKPSNMLVTTDGVPKLLDFGIAKLLNPELLAASPATTATALRLMTPEYASPEQVRGEPITTASDVYSLGVVLYELLSGHRPYRIIRRQPYDIMRVVCQEEPAKPSTAISRVEEVTPPDGTAQITLTPERVSQTRDTTPEKLRRRLKGDLDNIVLMAMRKEPQRRYGSVEQFSEDIRRYRVGLPVIAQKDTFTYRMSKFIQRHKVGVMAAALILISLLAGMATTLWQARVAEAERARAEENFNDVRQLANSFLFEFHDAIANLPGSTPARELVVRRALEYLDRLAQRAGDDPTLQRELATAYEKVGNVQGNPTNANLGDTAGALVSYHKALAIVEALVAAHPADAQARRSLALMNEKISDMKAWTGDVAGAVESGRQSLAIFKSLAEADPTNVKPRHSLAISYIKLGDVLGNPSFPNVGDRAGALRNYELSLAIWQALSASDSTNATTRRYLGLIYERIGTMQQLEDNISEALESYRKSLAIRKSFSADYPTNTDARRDLAIGYEKIGDILTVTGDTTRALQNYRQSLAIFEALSAADPNNANASRSLSISYEKVGDGLATTGDITGAVKIYRKSQVIREALSAADPTNAQIRRDLAMSYRKLGEAYTLLGKRRTTVGLQMRHWRQARSWFQKCLRVWLDMRDRGILRGSDTHEPDTVADKIAQCDAALAKLQHP